MNKKEIAIDIANKLGCTSSFSLKCISMFVNIVKESVIIDGESKISGFGVFTMSTKQPRRYWNVNSKAYEISNPKPYVRFKPSPKFLSMSQNESICVKDTEMEKDSLLDRILKEKTRLRRQLSDLEELHMRVKMEIASMESEESECESA